MKAFLRLLAVFLLLSLMLLISFLIWGEGFDAWLDGEAAADFFRARAAWAGPLGAGLLIADLVLPIPSTGILGGMGVALGWLPAALWGWAGLSLSGLTGYAIGRLGGTRLADRVVDPGVRARHQAQFNDWGSTAIVVTRLLPILPEVFSVLSGLVRMRFSRFVFATLLGSIPPALVYTWLGAQAREHPGPALWGLVGITAAAWLVFLTLHRRRSRG